MRAELTTTTTDILGYEVGSLLPLQYFVSSRKGLDDQEFECAADFVMLVAACEV
ncbi:MAG: hypothetical protein GY714_26535 [Desulfobacterales bacterium]|nr:hypothetical protein [Desulfobacterales bacterium]